MATSGRGNVVKAGDIVEGRYRIIRLIDEGGMGTVFLAEHVLIKRRVAIKILHPEFATDADVIERFMHEALAAGTLGHPNIVESTDMGFTRNDIPFIVFEFLEGTLLTEEIYRTKGMPIHRALKIAHQIASALHAAHTANIVHRDLKSDNVFLTDRDGANDHVKVLDFGISRFLESDENAAGRAMVVGTPEFMAPEQMTSPETVDKRADVYALGVILYEMLTARRPFSREDASTVMQLVLSEPPPPLQLAGAPLGFEEMILEKFLAKDPARRYQSMMDVQGALEAFNSILLPAAPQLGAPRKSEGMSQPLKLIELQPPVAKRRSRIGWLVGALVLGAAGGALQVLDHQTPTAIEVKPDLAPLQADAEGVATALDGEVRTALLRASGLSSAPLVRAAIETDAATVRDMAKDEKLVPVPRPGEVLELTQTRGGATTTLLRLPESAPPISPLADSQVRVETDGSNLVVVAGALIPKGTTETSGAVTIATPVDLTAIKRRAADHAREVSIVGLARPVVLIRDATPLGTRATTTTSVPIVVGRELRIGPLSLLAVVAAPPPQIASNPPFALGSYASFGAGALLLGVFALGRVRRSNQSAR